VSVRLEGIETNALIDTGSTVSTISHGFYKKHFDYCDITPLSSILSIECADGQMLPYEGYIELNLEIDGLPRSGNKLGDCVLLVVPDSNYNSTVPLLIGTNILVPLMEIIREDSGENFLQSADLHTPLYLAFRCILLRDKELERRKDRIAVIKSAEKGPVTIKPNSDVTVQGYLDKEVPYHPVCCMIHPTKGATIPDDVDITPALVPYKYGHHQKFCVQITNISTRTVTIQPRALLCELQPVTIENVHQLESDAPADDLTEIVNICTESLTHEELHRVKHLINRYGSMFSTDDSDVGCTSFVKHRIELTDDQPFKQRHRRIPPSMIEEVRNHLQQLLAAGIIRRSRSPWASNVVLVRKKNNVLRLCVDYRQLNERTVKDSYALPRVEEILESLSGNKFFTVLDMKSGYHQVEVSEDHKERTAFTVGPLGFF